MTEATPMIRRRANPADEIDHEIGELIGRVHRTPPPKLESAITEDIGRMSAEAVMQTYELTAKGVEEMGNAVKDRVAKLEAALVECDKDMKLIAEAAAMIREKGKLMSAQIEEASDLSKTIRSACDEFKRKVG